MFYNLNLYSASMLNTNQTTDAVPTLNYRQAMTLHEKQRQILEVLELRYPPDAAVLIQARGTLEELDLIITAQEQAGHESVVKLFNFNECETCGRDYNDEACGHRRADFYRDES